MYQSVTLAAGVAVEYTERADFLRILESSLSDLQIIFYSQGREVARAENVGEGYSETVPEGFDRVRITSTAGSVVALVMRYGTRVGYDKPPTGTVTLANANGPFTQTNFAITTTATQVLAANPARRYLMVQNNDAAGDIFVAVDGTTATALTGIKLSPGSAMEFVGYCPTGAVSLIGSIALNINVIVVSG